ncbi:hypothetical protein GF312_14335 [Candidatus Poribacteria bacterium]|nr:hypothetical protein [Candidatus Poribacteria bacterium]
MSFENPFKAEGKWYKGNLHTHTTNSDGAWSPERVVAEYKKNDYNFLFITDHNKVTDVANLSSNNMLVLYGEEIGAGKAELGQPYHIVALNLKEAVSSSDAPDAQGMINLIKAKGGEVILGHPYWSGLTMNDSIDLEDYLGVEVFNTTCHVSISKGHSMIQWDDLLARGRRLMGFAVDDTHQHKHENAPLDICYAWIMVKAAELNEDGIMKAIKSGCFYSSNGPTIKDINFEDDIISVSTSRVKSISLIARVSSGRRYEAKDGEYLTKVEHKIRGSENYIRVECIDNQGRMAWSNPIFLE